MPANNQADHMAILARKWMDGTITAGEMAEFEQWYASFDDAEPEMLQDETPEALRERLYDSIQRGEFPAEKGKMRNLYRYLAGAACVAFLTSFSFWWTQNRFSTFPFTRIVMVDAGAEIEKAMLPDGSIIWLRPGATLKYPASFSGGRRVSLSGEGLFEVAKDSLHPFTVSVGDYTATVMGTSFYIKESDNRRDMQLAVLTGKVKVGRKDANPSFGTQIVLPDEKLLTGDVPAVKRLSREESTSYAAGTGYDMNFRNTPFSLVVARIEQKFDVDIRGDLNRYASCRFTANMTDQGLDYTLKLLTRSVGITYKQEERIVHFEGGGCK
ncbi:FecR family protein [Anseongella ginsenosidimutans]|uniref:FecR family protein n=1 Tax=Anseongella ginsenosidimutans TaxID=496056 RepID=A0A4R3KW48_9SPHI|nr:FecR family protein [Anseongella ginsenosidimutans]QEC51464.1 DUF4974 domain-containing protein [Anseongella ginsenosidimutans]TCS89825.1 FecR family protein [Anseongella ginsenosidimutans]